MPYDDLAAFLADRLSEKIYAREEAQALEVMDALLPEYPRPEVPAGPLYERHEFHLEELLEGSDKVFVQTAYRALLKREPDAEGRAELLRKLGEQSVSRLLVIRELLLSDEGAARGVHVSGLRFAHRLARMRCLPVVGGVVSMLVNLGLLPDVEAHTVSQQRLAREASTGAWAVSDRIAGHVPREAPGEPDANDGALPLCEVLCLHNRELVGLGYRRCAGRSPTDDERAQALQRLATGAISPLLLLGELCERFATRPDDLRIAGLPSALSRERRYQLPVLGGFLRLGRRLHLLRHLDSILEAQRREALRRLEACESELVEHYNMSVTELKRAVIERSRSGDASPSGGNGRP